MLQANTEIELGRLTRASRPSDATLTRTKPTFNLGLGWILPALLFLAWSLASARGWVAPQILPAPNAVGQTLLENLQSGELLTNIGISLGRVVAGFFVGGLLGLALGIAMGLSRTVEDYLHPTFKAISQVPVLGWLPLAMMFLGIGEALKIAIIAQASLVPITMNTFAAIRGVSRNYIEVARVFRFSRSQLLRKVVLPAAVPGVFVGIRYGITQAWLSLVTVELLASSEGVGFMIVWGRQLFQLDLVLSAILVVGLVGLALDKGLSLLEARLSRWRPQPNLDRGAQPVAAVAKS